MMPSSVTDQQKHSAAHVLAMAVSRLYPNVKIGVGPVTKDGFYYDLDIPNKISEEDFDKIENEINNIIQENLSFQQIILPRDEAINMLHQRGQIYKAELIKAIPDEEISFFKTGEEFVDLCRGPHVSTTNQIGLVKLIKVEAVHWNEDITRPKIQRIYGKVFNNIDELNEYERLQHDIKYKNYKNLSVKYNFAAYSDDTLCYTLKGSELFNKVRKIIENEIGLNNYKELIIPNKIKNEVEINSITDKVVFGKNNSFRDYPLKSFSRTILETTSFMKKTTDLNVLFFKDYNIGSNSLSSVSDITEKMVNSLKRIVGEFDAEIITSNPEEAYTTTISNILQRNVVSHNKIVSDTSNVELYFKYKDRFGKEWNLAYAKFHSILNKANESILGIDFGFIISEIWKLLIEKHEGVMPFQLAPIDIVCIPANKKFNEYANKICEVLRNNNYICEVDNKSQSLKFKIRRAEMQNIPVQLILGNKEETNNAVSIRENHVDAGLVGLDDLINHLNNYFNSL